MSCGYVSAVKLRTLGYNKSPRCLYEGRRGVLGSMASRREFLCDPSHRIRFAYIPKHSSWLNQIEVIFGIIARRVIRPGSFTSKQDLKEKLVDFVNYYNHTFAKPLNWTYTGRPTQKLRDERPRSWREMTQSRKTEQILALAFLAELPRNFLKKSSSAPGTFANFNKFTA